MHLTDTDLEQFWRAATIDTPLVIIGGGRWGRTWSTVASRARGSSAGIAIAARTDPEDASAWARGESGVPGLKVMRDLREALEQDNPPVVAIIASRPRDHVRDGIEAVSFGLDVLVEKPISESVKEGARLVGFAREMQRLLVVGTEFALLPAFHYCARHFDPSSAGVRQISLIWTDPLQDFRHGAQKNRHDEASVLVDLLPHAYSIFRIFAGSAKLQVEEVVQDVTAERAWLLLRDEQGGRYELHCDKQANARRRLLEIEGPAKSASVDFTSDPPSIIVDGAICTNPDTLHMNSTLRLALGAFLAEQLLLTSRSPLSDHVDDLLRLQSELELF